MTHRVWPHSQNCVIIETCCPLQIAQRLFSSTFPNSSRCFLVQVGRISITVSGTD